MGCTSSIPVDAKPQPLRAQVENSATTRPVNANVSTNESAPPSRECSSAHSREPAPKASVEVISQSTVLLTTTTLATASVLGPEPCQPVNRVDAVPRELVHYIARFVPYEAALLARASKWLYSCYKPDPFLWIMLIIVARWTPEGRACFESHMNDIIAWCPSLWKYLGATTMVDIGESCEFSRDGSLVACQGHTLCVLQTNTWHIVANLNIQLIRPVLRFSESATLLAGLCFGE